MKEKILKAIDARLEEIIQVRGYSEWNFLTKLKREIQVEFEKNIPPTSPLKITLPIAEELWDDYSELIDDSIDDLQRFAGTTVITKANFMAMMKKFGNETSQIDISKGNPYDLLFEPTDKEDVIVLRASNEKQRDVYIRVWTEDQLKHFREITNDKS